MFADLLLCHVLHTDCTNARENGKNAYVFVCAAPDGKAMCFARRKKGHEGVKGTPVEDYQGILVHDHEKTFYTMVHNTRSVLRMSFVIRRTAWIMKPTGPGTRKCAL